MLADYRRSAYAFSGLALIGCIAFGFAGCSSSAEEESETEQTVNGCGVERWSVKTGTDPDVGKVNLTPQDTTITQITSLAAPSSLPANNRVTSPTLETQAWRFTNVTLQQYKLEADSDIHLVVTDGTSTMNVEIAAPSCVGSGSPLAQGISNSRAIFTAKHTPSGSFKQANDTISVVGVGFFDHPHGQTGGAKDGVELHPVIDICFGKDCQLASGGGGTDGGTDSGGGDSGGGDSGGCGTDGGGGSNGLASVKTAWVILMENHNWSSIKGSSSAPYVNNTLLPMGAHAENYVNLPGIHPSEPNYLWLEAGDNFGVTNDNPPSTNHQSTTQHLVTLLEASGKTWKAYAEGASGSSCPVTTSGLYAPKHVPFVFFDDIINNASRCTGHVRPYTELAGDLSSGNIANYNFLTPDLCDDMHNSSGCSTSDSVANGDTWLSNEIPKIMASSAYQSGGAIFITWDESEGGDLPIGMIVLSPFAKPGYTSNVAMSHSSTLRTMQEIFGVQPFLRAAATANDLSDMFVSTGGGGGGPCGDAGGGGDSGGSDAGTDSGQDSGGTDSGGGSCSHAICSTGGKLTSSCDPCATKICASDSFCCSNSWDATCVGEVNSICGQSCSGGGGGGGDAGTDSGGGGGSSCAHDVCAAGTKLTKTCDSCAQAVCASDSFCCTNSWDSQCVSEVASSGCGKSCP